MNLHAIEQKVINNINKYNLIDKGDLIVVGFSGGCDSVSLLNILLNISKILDIELLAIHINHMIRGDEALRDEKFCVDFCSKTNTNIVSIKVNVPELVKEAKKSAEEVGRQERYRVFNEAGEEHSNFQHKYKIAVAHNRDDLAETVILNLIRGTSIDGLKGIDFKRDNIIRPMLDIPRDELERYCIDKGLEFVSDSSNIETIYKRNKIRHNILPVIANVTEGSLSEKLYNMSRLIIDDTDFLNICADNEYRICLLKSENKKILIDVKYFNTLHISLRRRIVRILIKNISGSLQGIESIHINDIIELALKNTTGKYLCLPSMIRVKTEYDILKVWIADKQVCEIGYDVNFSVKINIPGETEVLFNRHNTDEQTKLIIVAKLIDPNTICSEDILSAKQNKTVNIQKFDFDLTGQDLFLRNRQEGDILVPYKFNGTKKLKKYLIDEKVPLNFRNQIPLVARDNEVLWILGKTINQKYICTSNTKNIVELEIIQ